MIERRIRHEGQTVALTAEYFPNLLRSLRQPYLWEVSAQTDQADASIDQKIKRTLSMTDSVIAVFSKHEQADAAVRKLAGDGFPMTALSVVGKGYHTEEKAVGFYNMGDRVKFWGSRGAMWGGLWGLFFGGMFMTIPIVGHVVVLGYLAALALSAIESAAMVGGMSAIGAALVSMNIPKDSVVSYETAVKADGFLVMAHGTANEMARAKAILAETNPTRLDVHLGLAASANEPAALLPA